MANKRKQARRGRARARREAEAIEQQQLEKQQVMLQLEARYTQLVRARRTAKRERVTMIANERLEVFYSEVNEFVELVAFVKRVLGPKPAEREAAEEWEWLVARAEQVANPKTAAMTPGNVIVRR